MEQSKKGQNWAGPEVRAQGYLRMDPCWQVPKAHLQVALSLLVEQDWGELPFIQDSGGWELEARSVWGLQPLLGTPG